MNVLVEEDLTSSWCTHSKMTEVAITANVSASVSAILNYTNPMYW